MLRPMYALGTPATAVPVSLPIGSVADTVRAFTDAAGSFFDSLAQVRPGDLALALLVFCVYLVLRARASFNACRAAYPDAPIEFRRIWGAYIAAFGLNGIVPAGGGSVVQLVLTKASIPRSRYSTITVALCVVLVFDTFACAAIIAYAFTQSVFPRPADFVDLNSFDISFFAGHIGLVLFIITAMAAAALCAYAWASVRYARFRDDLRQGTAILHQRRRYLLGMCVPQGGAYACRIGSYWLMLEAFRIGATLRNALLMLAAQIIAAIVPFTPGGAGAVQALLVVVFAGAASATTVAAFSVGQQIAYLALTLALAFGAMVVVFRYRSFRALLRDTRATHAADLAAEREEALVSGPAAPSV
jgi:glycosyltransferase 2 family protein